MNFVLLAVVVTWALIGVATTMFRAIPYSFDTPLLGGFYSLIWVGVGLVLAVNTASLWKFGVQPRFRMRVLTAVWVISPVFVLMVLWGPILGLGDRIWFSVHQREWTRVAETAVESGGQQLPLHWEYDTRRGTDWIGVHYGDGLLDNWVGYIYSSSGNPPGNFPDALFKDQLTGCMRLSSRWFICGFT